MRVLFLGILVIFLLLAPSARGGEIVFQMSDPTGDDYGAGKLNYPAHEVFVPGLFDLQKFVVSRDEENYYFDCRFSAVTNPFGAPEGFFHQLCHIYLDTMFPGGNEEIEIGGYTFLTTPDYGWEVHLRVAPFGESLLELTTDGTTTTRHKVTSLLLSDGKTIRTVVERSLLPEMAEPWRYYVLVGSFDGLESDLLRTYAQDLWGVSGEGPPIFDLLAPRWGIRSQKQQLLKSVLHPVGSGWQGNLPWLKLLLIFTAGLGLFFWGLYLWRWYNAQN